jgi:Ca2+-binding EF-hand superfamily protein
VLLDRVRAQLAARGSHGILALGRKFRSMDDDGSRTLSLPEFAKALKEMDVHLQPPEVRAVFAHFDTDNSGSVDFEELLKGLRGELNEKRAKLVDLVFGRLDTDSSGLLEPEELLKKYDASQHPDVLAGRATAEEVRVGG